MKDDDKELLSYSNSELSGDVIECKNVVEWFSITWKTLSHGNHKGKWRCHYFIFNVQGYGLPSRLVGNFFGQNYQVQKTGWLFWWQTCNYVDKEYGIPRKKQTNQYGT